MFKVFKVLLVFLFMIVAYFTGHLAGYLEGRSETWRQKKPPDYRYPYR